MNLLVISCSLNPGSRSRLLAEEITTYLEEGGSTVDSLDLRKTQMPLCDGSSMTSSEIVTTLHERIGNLLQLIRDVDQERQDQQRRILDIVRAEMEQHKSKLLETCHRIVD